MIQDIRLHGFVANTSERYEYFTTVIGPGLHMRFFYEQGDDMRGTYDRFFLSGNEIALYADKVYHRGNGGTFCEYMLGMEQPIKEILKPEIRNRLVMYGARYDDEGERIIFTNDTSGSDSYTRMVDEGHAFANFYFFIAGDIQGDLKTVQETVLRFAGKILKRSDLNLDTDGNNLATRLYSEMAIPRWTLFILKLIDRHALDYYRKFAEIYRSGRALIASDRDYLNGLADRYQLSRSMRERLELDVIQKQPENRQLIDGYKETLVAQYQGYADERTVQFKRNRVRTLGARRHLPPALFDKLDRMHRPRRGEVNAPSFVLSTRKIFTDLMTNGRVKQGLMEEDLIGLLQARQDALEQHYGKFDDLIDELGQGQSGANADLFSIIVGHLERFQTAYEIVHSLAFVDDYELQEEQVILLARCFEIIDNVKDGLCDRLIFQTLERQHYLNIYGRERLRKLREGLNGIMIGEHQPVDIITTISRINAELRLRRAVDSLLRERVRDIYKQPLSKQEQEFLRNEISHRLIQQGFLSELITSDVFAAALFSLREEFLYLNEMLPQIIANRDRRLREDFLENSELDRFRTEELEQQYFRTHQLSPEVVEWFMGEARN